MTPILYSFRRCPYAMRARLALDVSRQACELREVTLKNKPPEMLSASPKATVPVLVTGDGVIDESLDIMLWTLRRNDPERWLTSEQESLEKMLELIDACDGPFKSHLDRYKYPNRFAGAKAERSRSEAATFLDVLEARLSASGYLSGARIALTDMAIAPFVRQFANVDAVWFAQQPWPCVQRWLAAFTSSDRFHRIMRTIEPWTAGTRGVEFPFD